MEKQQGLMMMKRGRRDVLRGEDESSTGFRKKKGGAGQRAEKPEKKGGKREPPYPHDKRDRVPRDGSNDQNKRCK